MTYFSSLLPLTDAPFSSLFVIYHINKQAQANSRSGRDAEFLVNGFCPPGLNYNRSWQKKVTREGMVILIKTLCLINVIKKALMKCLIFLSAHDYSSLVLGTKAIRSMTIITEDNRSKTIRTNTIRTETIRT